MPTTDSVIQKIDELLEDDKTFTTRTGVRFMTSVLRDALVVIGNAAEKVQKNDLRLDAVQDDFLKRIGSMENALNEFFSLQNKEKDKAESERTFYRRSVIGGILAIVISQIAQWILR